MEQEKIDFVCPNCYNIPVLSKFDNILDLFCTSCGNNYCGQCKNKSHYPCLCEDLRKWDMKEYDTFEESEAVSNYCKRELKQYEQVVNFLKQLESGLKESNPSYLYYGGLNYAFDELYSIASYLKWLHLHICFNHEVAAYLRHELPSLDKAFSKLVETVHLPEELGRARLRIDRLDAILAVVSCNRFLICAWKEFKVQSPLSEKLRTENYERVYVQWMSKNSRPVYFEREILIPEDQFVAEYPSFSSVKVSVPSWNVIEITVQSLLETVASLKEKIAEKIIQIPAAKLKVWGNAAGFLEDDSRSLAHYNVEAGETLTLECEDQGIPPREGPNPRVARLYMPYLVPEDQFLAQHPDLSTIRVSYPKRKVVEITVSSSENVASLKQKIAEETHMRIENQTLSGKAAGILKDDNRSLAFYNVEAGETLTLSDMPVYRARERLFYGAKELDVCFGL